MSQRPTPQSIAVCALIAMQSDPSSPFHEVDLTSREQQHLSDVLETAVIGKPIPLWRWMKQLTELVGDDISSLLLDTLFLASESVDSLLDLMESLRAAVAEGLADVVSVHGVYLRQVSLGMEELSFESVTMLWQDFVQQLDETEQVLDGEEQVQSNNQSTLPLPLAESQQDDVLRQHCLDMERGTTESQSYEAVELEILTMMDRNPEMPSGSFLRFLNALKHGERVAALEALHQFFDHAAVQQNRDVLQFSSILLAMAYTSFGDPSLALMATEEVVRVAQQAKDSSCVAFSLGWLVEGQESGLREELLRRCTTRASQGQIRSLVTGSNLRLALQLLQDPKDPPRIWESVAAATTEASTNNLTTYDRPTFMTQSPSETMGSLARQMWVAAGVWDALGMPVLAGLATQTTLKHHNANLSREACVAAVNNMARAFFYGTQSNDLPPAKGPVSVQSVQLHANILAKISDSRQSHGLNANSDDSLFLPSVVAIMYDLAVNSVDAIEVRSLETVHHSIVQSRNFAFDGSTLEHGIQRCRYLCRIGDWEGSRYILLHLLKSSREQGTPAFTARLLVQLALLELEANPNQNLAALPHVLEALFICESSNLQTLHAVALSVLARVHLRQQSPKRALAILKATLPILLQREQMYVQAEAYLTKAKCHIQLSSRNVQPQQQRREMQTAIQDLKLCENRFQRQGDLFRLQEVYYLMARVLAQAGQVSARDKASQQFLNVVDLAKSHQCPGILQCMLQPETLPDWVQTYCKQ